MTKRKFANLVSTVGNPLILSVLVAIYINFKSYPLKQALTLTGILVLCAVVPVFFYINRKVKEGNYADHDVSARTKRPSLYLIGLSALGVMILALYLSKQPMGIVFGAWAAWLLTLLSFLINFKLKTSLHVGFSFLIAFLALSSDLMAGGILLAFGFLVGWSRLILKRHTLPEIFMGASLGTIIGTIYWSFV
ncbi:MAG: phosphatase PAP2 family protein [Spirosomataceae bacterium]